MFSPVCNISPNDQALPAIAGAAWHYLPSICGIDDSLGRCSCSVSSIGRRALLKTNTLTPLLKRLEHLDYISRSRRAEDERVVEIDLTEKGMELKNRCSCIPESLLETMGISIEKIESLKKQLNELMAKLEDSPAAR